MGTKLDHDLYSQFCSSALDLLLIDIEAPQRVCADNFISIWRQSEDLDIDSSHPVFAKIDIETLKLILTELCPMESESVTVPNRERERLYGSLLTGCPAVGNIECLKMLLYRIDMESKACSNGIVDDDVYTFGVDGTVLDGLCQRVWAYYDETIGYDVEMSCHAVMQLLECMLSGHNKLWTVMVHEETLTRFAVIMAEHELLSVIKDLRELIEPHCARFEQLMAALTEVDPQLFVVDHDQRVYH